MGTGTVSRDQTPHPTSHPEHPTPHPTPYTLHPTRTFLAGLKGFTLTPMTCMYPPLLFHWKGFKGIPLTCMCPPPHIGLQGLNGTPMETLRFLFENVHLALICR